MQKKILKLKPDAVLKNYWGDNEQFADLFNAVLFDGETVIKADELEDADTEESTVLENRGYAESIQASRDVIKIEKKSETLGVQFVMYGLENQERIHYAMPMRVMGLDYAAYKKQYDRNSKKYRNSEGIDEDEYLSRMKRTDKFTPVITVVMYYGEKPWDGAVSLHGMLNIPQRMINLASDYKMNLVEARENALSLHNINNVDLFNLLEILLNKSSPIKEIRDKAVDYADKHNVDKSVIMAVAGAANSRIDYNSLEKRGDADMCTVFEETRLEGRLEGEAKGIVEAGYDFGLSDNDILNRLQKKLNVSEEAAQGYIEMYGKIKKNESPSF